MPEIIHWQKSFSYLKERSRKSKKIVKGGGCPINPSPIKECLSIAGDLELSLQTENREDMSACRILSELPAWNAAQETPSGLLECSLVT